MQQEAEAYLAPRLAGTNAAELLLQEHPEEDRVLDDVAGAFDEAAPEFSSKGPAARPELHLLATPPGPAGERLCALARASCRTPA